ncbi:hypothetical protein VOLCADRAFT_105745 [Volvox carteri f. nagariensis]|uniref:Ureidoglycolate hydrolase n=1 Tax=Volvox carteri f. nagariensis TaxID=3068 RepID=D8U2R8_VOLCA|nr:uncharacterized protein VOLCADRAFT_105745 [Volvox carteri f. nagariensis]EFJ45854.1 hypothetical protein VOLCADRAFT_105745 [Volvox carteri f. nagariensis]|eukprot:XP_002952932.1 hypothetical protein VOLCADRAFT_105745 [Volvox carteri f. nagariensis]
MLTCSNRVLLRRVDTRRRRSISASAQMNAGSNATQINQITLKVTPLTPENIKPFGQIISSSEDGKLFDQDDAQLVLNQGTPRFYIMRLPARGLRFHRITYHGRVTQCLGGLTPPHSWYMALAAPSGSLERYPQPEDIRVFRIPFGSFIKLEVGTWHAGPLFSEPGAMDFYNLELADTNVTDHNTHDYRRHSNTEFIVEDDHLPTASSA